MALGWCFLATLLASSLCSLLYSAAFCGLLCFPAYVYRTVYSLYYVMLSVSSVFDPVLCVKKDNKCGVVCEVASGMPILG